MEEAEFIEGRVINSPEWELERKKIGHIASHGETNFDGAEGPTSTLRTRREEKWKRGSSETEGEKVKRERDQEGG